MKKESSCEAILKLREPGKIRHHHHSNGGSELLLDKIEIVRELGIRPDQYVIDAGCGNGYMAKEFSAAVGDEGCVYAVDCYEESIKTLAETIQETNIIAVQGDITKTTTINAESVDLIYLSNVIHGFDSVQIDGFQAESARLLKDTGRIAIVEINKENTPFGPPADSRFSPKELDLVMSFKLLKTVALGPHFYMQVYSK